MAPALAVAGLRARLFRVHPRPYHIGWPSRWRADPGGSNARGACSRGWVSNLCLWAAFARDYRWNSAAIGQFTAMIAITITPAAHQAIKASLLGTVRPGPGGLIRIWLARKFVDRLGQMRGPGESYSDMILRLTIEA